VSAVSQYFHFSLLDLLGEGVELVRKLKAAGEGI